MLSFGDMLDEHKYIKIVELKLRINVPNIEMTELNEMQT